MDFDRQERQRSAWERASSVGLWLAALVGLATIIASREDASRVRATVPAQSDEMRAQQPASVDADTGSARTSFWKRLARAPWGAITVGLATVVAAGATVTYTVLADRQWRVMQGQLQEMRAEQRPWISLADGSGLQSVYFDSVNKQLRAVVNFALNNTGKSPATSVYVNAQMSIAAGMPYGSMKAWQTAVCHLPSHPPGFTLFPGALQGSYQLTLGVPPRTLNPDENSVPFWNIGGAIITACIVYRDAVSGSWHYTPMAFQIFTPRIPGKPCCTDPIGAAAINGDNFLFRSWDWDNLPPT